MKTHQLKNKVQIVLYILFLGFIYSCANRSQNKIFQIRELKKSKTLKNTDKVVFDKGESFLDFENNFDYEKMLFLDYSETYSFLSLNQEFKNFSVDTKCKIALKIFKKTRCKIKRKKFAKQIVKQIGSSHISYKKGELTLPKFNIFKNEINRLNVLVEIFYNQNIANCQGSECDSNEILVNCLILEEKSIPKILEDKYIACLELLKQNINTDFLASLKEIGNILDKFQDNKIDSNTVKLVFDSEIKKLKEKTDS